MNLSFPGSCEPDHISTPIQVAFQRYLARYRSLLPKGIQKIHSHPLNYVGSGHTEDVGRAVTYHGSLKEANLSYSPLDRL